MGSDEPRLRRLELGASTGVETGGAVAAV